MQQLRVQKLKPTAVLPQRATEGSAGYDLCACLEQPLTLPAGGRVLVPTGIAIQLEGPSYAAFVFGRSGLGIKRGIVPSNGVGVVDSDYRGEIMVGLTNHGQEDYQIAPGERIAQMVIMPVATPQLVEAEALEDTQRGQGGFGSTGR
ncbi:dUTP diphosphatase [Oscillospiraceae bacterium MB08-C2-2]|nr:dUTP diphosphatase [Oscillospiraceae bacterium MB08-C2-2]